MKLGPERVVGTGTGSEYVPFVRVVRAHTCLSLLWQAVLETIIRRMALTTDKRTKLKSRENRSLESPRLPTRLNNAKVGRAACRQLPLQGSSSSSTHSRRNTRRFSIASSLAEAAMSVRKEEWDEAIAESLF